MDIYTKINNHKMMTNEDIINIVDDRLKKLNLYKNKIMLNLVMKKIYILDMDL